MALSVLLLALVACGQSEPRNIEGYWVAENFRLQGLKLPIGPNLHITPHSMDFGAGLATVPLVGIESHKNEITLKTEIGVDIVFAFESKDRIFFEVPLVGYRIYYQRGNAPVVAAVAAVATPAVQSAPKPAPQVVEKSLAQVEYQAALEALRHGQDDAALRSLALAFQAGFVDWARLDQEPLFERFQGDVRYQVIQQRWRK